MSTAERPPALPLLRLVDAEAMLNRPNNEDVARLLAACLIALAILMLVLALIPATTARASIAETWSWPIHPPWRIVREYAAPPTPYGVGHRGIDLAATQEIAVRAPAAGIVLFAGTVADRGVISIDHGNGVVSSFEPVSATVISGERVRTGDVIGVVTGLHASTSGSGSAFGPKNRTGSCACLHMGTRLNGEYISPIAFLSEIDRAVLLPWRD